jgi:hypothetical protein
MRGILDVLLQRARAAGTGYVVGARPGTCHRLSDSADTGFISGAVDISGDVRLCKRRHRQFL